MDKENTISNCSNCGKEIPQKASFCPYCGQSTKIKKIKLFHLFKDFFDNFVIFDLKSFRTLMALLIPGKITKDFFSGKHGRYTSPWRLFLISIVIMLIFANIDSKIKEISRGKTDDNNVSLEINKGIKINLGNASTIEKEYIDSLERKIRNSGSNVNLDSIIDQIAKDSIISENKLKSLAIRWQKKLYKNTFNFDKVKNKIHQYDISNLQKSFQILDTAYLQGDSLVRKVTDSCRTVLKNQLTDIYLDSITMINTSVSKYDMNTLSLDKIKSKYNIADEGFLKNTLRSITYKFSSKKITFDSFMDYIFKNINWFIIFLLPFSALIFKLLYIRRKRYFVEHLVFNLHAHSAIMFMYSIFIIIAWIRYDMIQNAAAVFISFAPVLYYILATKKYYNQSWFKTISKSFIFFFIYFILIIISAILYAGIAAIMIT